MKISNFESYRENPMNSDSKSSAKDSIRINKRAFAIIKDFSTSSFKVWCYIASVKEHNNDEVHISIDDCAEFCNYSSKVAVYKGIIELLEANFIFRKTGSNSLYFVNIEKLF
jgi:hypothetical protein